MKTLPRKFATRDNLQNWLLYYLSNISRDGSFYDQALGDELADEFALYFGSDPYNACFISDGEPSNGACKAVVTVPKDFLSKVVD